MITVQIDQIQPISVDENSDIMSPDAQNYEHKKDSEQP